MSTSKLSKIELGHAAPSVTDVERILTAIGVSDAVKAEYMAAARAEATEATAWRLYRRLGFHKKQQEIKALDATMTLLRLFQPSLVPGLLQTPEYIRAILTRHDLGEEVLQRTINGRLERQGILYDPTKQLQFIITESVLKWRIVSASMMAGQLDRIISLSRLPNIDIRVVALASPQRDVPGHSFVIRDNRIVTVETVHAELAVTDPRDVALYVKKFEGFASFARSGDSMRSLVTALRDEYLRERETD